MAISAFGLKIDYPCVRGVFYVSIPDSVIDFMQKLGRLGRDGQRGMSVVYLGQREGQRSGLRSEELLPTEVQVMRAYVDQL
jgi:ATP-dependent DNA helicase RecQ